MLNIYFGFVKLGIYMMWIGAANLIWHRDGKLFNPPQVAYDRVVKPKKNNCHLQKLAVWSKIMFIQCSISNEI